MEGTGVGVGKGFGSKATQFKPGSKGGLGRPRGSGGQGSDSSLLDVLRHVCLQPASKDKTLLQKLWRQLAKEAPTEFMARMIELEKLEVAAKSEKLATAANGEISEVELKIEEAIDRVIQQLQDMEPIVP